MNGDVMSEKGCLNPFDTQRAIFNDTRLSSSETLVALAVLAKRFSKSGECKPKVTELVHMTRLSERTVRSAVGTLAAKNVLRVVRTGQANEYEFIEADVAERGAIAAGQRGAMVAGRESSEVQQLQVRGATVAGRSLNIDNQSSSKENPSHARTSAHAREADIAPWEEEPELPDPETLPDSEMQSAASWEDLQEADALMQAEALNNPTRHLQKKCPYVALKDLYHAVLPELEPVRIDTERRKRDVQELWREVVKRQECRTVADGLLQFQRYFEKVRRSRIFEQAVKSDLPWQVDFSWLMTSKTFVKFVEGGYD